jgi:ABC-2 type transport system permease protein
MTALVRGELIKTRSTRTVLAYGAIGVLLAIIHVLVVTSEDPIEVPAKQDAITGFPFVLFLLALVGAAGEYRHRTAAPAALAAGRDRAALLVARAGAYAVTGVAVAVPMAVVSLGLGLPMLEAGPGPALELGDVAPVVAGTLAGAALSAIMGVAVGALVRNQVAAVVGALILGFVVTPPDRSPRRHRADVHAVRRHGDHGGRQPGRALARRRSAGARGVDGRSADRGDRRRAEA